MNTKTKNEQLVSTLSNISEVVEGRSPWADARRRFMKNKAAVASLVILILIALTIIIGPHLLQHTHDATDWNALSLAPTMENGHYLGTDELGRDLLARTLQGGGITFQVGIVGTLVSVIIGVSWGAIAGFFGGKVDALMMRIVDVLYALPFMLFAILLMTFFGRDLYLMFVALGAISWLDMARIVRGQTLSLKSKEFVEAAHAIGVSQFSIIFRHIVPNLLGIVVVYATITIPGVIMTESVLSFLGLGVQEPNTSWGVLVQEGQKVMESQPWMLLVPGIFLSVTLYCANYVGDGLRDALDPKDR
ncbi:ABC transporter permease subunit [Vogesella urethralis]|jgi:oligopeptide transport system permease protein|uniref:ABC transporter permease subunit n=1 Tax=Vogesella urethralis TaxID=2592656 RepID=UPI001184D549|nr:ABC transporter permease subunit [Vogesella urethralis]MEC5205267.1 oligopeptide transport system permease protein [Vogesella perlucida]